MGWSVGGSVGGWVTIISGTWSAYVKNRHCSISAALKDAFQNNFSRYSLDDSQTTDLTHVSSPCPSLNTAELIVIHNHPCKHSSKLQPYIRFTTSRCLGV